MQNFYGAIRLQHLIKQALFIGSFLTWHLENVKELLYGYALKKKGVVSLAQQFVPAPSYALSQDVLSRLYVLRNGGPSVCVCTVRHVTRSRFVTQDREPHMMLYLLTIYQMG
jgi:hypothetical protein